MEIAHLVMAAHQPCLAKGQSSSAAQAGRSSDAWPACRKDENCAEQPAAAQNGPAQQVSETNAHNFCSVTVRTPGTPAALTEDATVSAASSVEPQLPRGASAPDSVLQKPSKIRDILKPLHRQCQLTPDARSWWPPWTEPLDIVESFDWPNMLGYGGGFPEGKLITSIVPTFYPDEPDPNQQNKPRLDLLVSFNDGETVRYHPSAHPISSRTPQPTDAMQKRYNLAKNLARKAERA